MPRNGSSAAVVAALAARLWITTGSPSDSASASCSSEQGALLPQRLGAVVAVEPGLPDRDDLPMREQRA